MSADSEFRSADFVFASAHPRYMECAAPCHPDAIKFLALWRQEAETRDIEIGKDIPTRAFACFLANLMIVEPIGDASDCHIRLAGHLVRNRYGRDVSGEKLSALLSPDTFRRKRAWMQQVRESGLVRILTVAVERGTARPLHFEAIILRARAPNGHAIWNIVGIFPHAR